MILLDLYYYGIGLICLKWRLTNMDARFNAYKVKYDNMDLMTRPIFISQKIDRANIFISLDDIYSRLKNSQVNREFQCCGNLATKQMISNILNLVAHYREWAVRKKINVKMVVYYSTSSIFESKSIYKGYRDYYNERNDINNPDCFFINNCIREAVSILTTIFQYIDSAYIINTGKVEPAIFPYICANEFPEFRADWNFIVTKDEVELQYASFEKFSIIYPKGEDSKILSSISEVWELVAEREKIHESLCKKYPDVYILALSLMGNKKRSIKKIKGISWRTIFDRFDKTISCGDYHPSLVGSDFLKWLKDKNYDSDQISKNYDVLSVKFMSTFTNDISKELIKTQFIDTPDYASLIDLNRQPNMFERCPINIRFLTRQFDINEIDPFKLGYIK